MATSQQGWLWLGDCSLELCAGERQQLLAMMYRKNYFMYVVQATEKWCSCLTEDTAVGITKLSPSCSCIGGWVNELCNIGGIVLNAESRSTGRKPCQIATLSTANLTRTVLGSNPSLRGERPATDRPVLAAVVVKPDA